MKKALLSWLIYFIVTGTGYYFWFENRSIFRAVIFGAVVGCIGAGIYYYQNRGKTEKNS